MHRGCFVWTPTPPLSGRRTPRLGPRVSVCGCLLARPGVMAGSGGPASRVRSCAPHLSFGRCGFLFLPLKAGFPPLFLLLFLCARPPVSAFSLFRAVGALGLGALWLGSSGCFFFLLFVFSFLVLFLCSVLCFFPFFFPPPLPPALFFVLSFGVVSSSSRFVVLFCFFWGGPCLRPPPPLCSRPPLPAWCRVAAPRVLRAVSSGRVLLRFVLCCFVVLRRVVPPPPPCSSCWWWCCAVPVVLLCCCAVCVRWRFFCTVVPASCLVVCCCSASVLCCACLPCVAVRRAILFGVVRC